MRLIDIVDVVLVARLGALPWGRASLIDPLHRRASLCHCVIHSCVAALNRNCQLGAGRVRSQKRLGVRGAPSNSPCDSASICQWTLVRRERCSHYVWHILLCLTTPFQPPACDEVLSPPQQISRQLNERRLEGERACLGTRDRMLH